MSIKLFKKRPQGFRFWLSAVTYILIVVILWFSRSDLIKAWNLLGRSNLLILLWIIPVQIASYYASTEIFFTYLRGRGQVKNVGVVQSTKIALEYNFVNHVFPTAGVSGASYMVWRLGKMGVSAGQATMSQIINYTMLGLTFMAMMIMALVWAVIENKAANWIVMATTIAAVILVMIVLFGSYLVSSRSRLMSFAHWLTRLSNKVVSAITFGRKKNVVSAKKMEIFFADIQNDYFVLRDNKSLLKKPIFWAFICNLLNILLIAVAFWSLGSMVSLPILLISFGAAAASSFLVLTPGGVGAYEVAMIAVLTAGGISADAATAGVILARVILVVGTVIFGLAVYQSALRKYGQPDLEPNKNKVHSQLSGKDRD